MVEASVSRTVKPIVPDESSMASTVPDHWPVRVMMYVVAGASTGMLSPGGRPVGWFVSPPQPATQTTMRRLSCKPRSSHAHS